VACGRAVEALVEARLFFVGVDKAREEVEGCNTTGACLVEIDGFRCGAALGEVNGWSFAVIVGKRKVQHLPTLQSSCCFFCVDKHRAFLVLLPRVRRCLRSYA